MNIGNNNILLTGGSGFIGLNFLNSEIKNKIYIIENKKKRRIKKKIIFT